MKRIVYAGSRLLTGDDIAVAVLEYCAALADADTAETVEIPVLDDSGARSMATLLVGPASQIVAEDVHSEFEELVDTDTVALLQQKTRAHRPTATTSTGQFSATDDNDQSWDDQY
jgi:hypothetical protein